MVKLPLKFFGGIFISGLKAGGTRGTVPLQVTLGKTRGQPLCIPTGQVTRGRFHRLPFGPSLRYGDARTVPVSPGAHFSLLFAHIRCYAVGDGFGGPLDEIVFLQQVLLIRVTDENTFYQG